MPSIHRRHAWSTAGLLLFVLLVLAPLPAFGQQGAISGLVVDLAGTAVAHAHITLSAGHEPDRDTQSTATGEFSFDHVDPGPYRLSFTAEGFAVKTIDGALRPGDILALPPTILAAAKFNTEVTVTPTVADIAEVQIKGQETQRLFGLVPNYFVNYDLDAAPLNARQKFQLTWKGFLDPTAFIGTAIGAGIAQARNTNPGFGLGAQGYAKRYATFYAEFATSRVINKVILPTVFQQDPRYFYKGRGTTQSRVVYAISRSVICRGDDKHWQPCYSSLISRFASGALTNLYLPSADRNSARTILENATIGIGGNAVGNLLQEFVARKLTRKKP